MTREEAIRQIENRWSIMDYGESEALGEALDMAIEALQTKVVRCKDCKHRSDGGWCDVYIQPRMEADFCNHGERQYNYFGERREP